MPFRNKPELVHASECQDLARGAVTYNGGAGAAKTAALNMKALTVFAIMLAAMPACATAAGPVGGQFEMFDVGFRATGSLVAIWRSRGRDRCAGARSPSRARCGLTVAQP